jgi:hypothetical protein
MIKPCFYGDKCTNPECSYVHLNAPKQLIKCYHFFGKGCKKGDACPFLHGANEQKYTQEKLEEVRMKRPANEELPLPDKKTKVEVEEEVKALEPPAPTLKEVQLAPVLKPSGSLPKIMTLDEIKAKKRAKRPPSTPEAKSPVMKAAEPEKSAKVLTLQEIKAKKAKSQVTPSQQSPESKVESVISLQKRPREEEVLEPVKRPKVTEELASLAENPEAAVEGQDKGISVTWTEAVFASVASIEEKELADKITTLLSTSEGIDQLVGGT